jgi:hypothetical protein
MALSQLLYKLDAGVPFQGRQATIRSRRQRASLVLRTNSKKETN